jgi:catechol 2,3-dioxygenase-like lactoylglutathione lyase family enzyme
MEQVISNLLGDFERGKMSRRQLVQSLAVSGGAAAVGAGPASAASPIVGKGFKAVAVNHISYGVADYARSRDFYSELFAMPVSRDDGKQCILSFGDSLLVLRKTRQPDDKPYIDHMAYTIANWDKDKVKAELERRGLNPRPDNNSFHIKDPDGFDVQIEADDAAQQR